MQELAIGTGAARVLNERSERTGTRAEILTGRGG